MRDAMIRNAVSCSLPLIRHKNPINSVPERKAEQICGRDVFVDKKSVCSDRRFTRRFLEKNGHDNERHQIHDIYHEIYML